MRKIVDWRMEWIENLLKILLWTIQYLKQQTWLGNLRKHKKSKTECVNWEYIGYSFLKKKFKQTAAL